MRLLKNLTPYARGELALKLEPLYAAKAKERQVEHGNAAPGRKSLMQNSAEVLTTRTPRMGTIAAGRHFLGGGLRSTGDGGGTRAHDPLLSPDFLAIFRRLWLKSTS
jgi:hypothetical protein